MEATERWELHNFTDDAHPIHIHEILFDRAGRFVWHCHIVEHEDHEMMRPYRIGPQSRLADSAGPSVDLHETG